ncbi:hypothetical protein ID866_4130 [Astraeus odoratus]|nr:hypothetical protein ID866_4130 [Astraeus odoratus]
MSIPYAFVTLLTSDLYLPGALALAGALKDVHRNLPPDQQVIYETVCLVTPETLDVTSIKLLRKAFDVVVGVEVLVQPDTRKLALLGRPDLDTVLTKLHVFRLAQYSKIIFLDADVLPVHPLSHLFNIEHEFAAVPDVGWPDIFNSGVMVFSPGEDKFNQVYDLLKTRGSWDGGDQGILNEWRGDNWHRLSFTYNTTPTAAYTYAPAYERFGSQISVIHFIGPNKPWYSIPYRAPGSSATNMSGQTSSSMAPSTHERAYDYASLVDRWYDVYDRHYRSQSVLPSPRFEVRRYTATWDEQSNKDVRSEEPSRVLSLDDLRRVAIEGMNSLSISSGSQTRGEGGVYRTMPLEGRFDLMRPLTRADRKEQEELSSKSPSSQSTEDQTVSQHAEPPQPQAEPSTPVSQIALLPSTSVRTTTLPTPGPDELPPAPHTRLLSLPPTPLHHVPEARQSTPSTRDIRVATGSPSESVRNRPSSPPLLKWDPAIEPPPNHPPPSTFSQADTYFPNVWDDDHGGRSSDISMSTLSSSSAAPVTSDEAPATIVEVTSSKPWRSPTAFFDAPLTPDIPHLLLRQGSYSNVFGNNGETGTPTPDRKKVKPIFPWEDRRHTPGRVFPGDDSQPPHSTHVRSLAATAAPATSTPERKSLRFPPAMPSPLPEIFQPTGGAWANESGLRRMSSKLHPSGAPTPASESLYMRSRKLLEANSQDGDVEDEIDSEDEEGEAAKLQSLGDIVEVTSRQGILYRSIGVQTDPRDTKDEGVQITPVRRRMVAWPREVSNSSRWSWSPDTRSNMQSADTAVDISMGIQSHVSRPLALARPMISRGVSAALEDDDGSLTSTFPTSPTVGPPSVPSPSVPSLHKPLITSKRYGKKHDNSPSTSRPSYSDTPANTSQHHARKGSRVWDPARGVEEIKRGSEEVLAKFLKMGSPQKRA